MPGTHPIETLALTLATHLPDRSLKSIREDLADDSARGLHLLARQLSTQREQRVVLVIDQFEELFTLTTSEAERRQFIDLIVAAVTEPAGPLIVVLTLRADFYDRLLMYAEAGQILQQHQYVVLPMEPYELRAVIERPAALPDVQLLFEDTLVGDLLYETQGQGGALPLLEFTLDFLFQCREGYWLTQQAYQRIGGVRGALAKHAEATYAALPSDDYRRLARVLFLRLIDPGQTEQDTTRRRAALSELLLPDTHEAARLREVADTFVSARLLTTNEVAGTTVIEVSHEALIREWMRLAYWLDEARDDIHLQHTISEDVVEWEHHGKPDARLYRGSQLREARAWARRNSPSRQEVTFLQASVGHQRRSVVLITAPLLLLVLVSGIALRLFLVPNVPPPTLVTTLNESGPGSIQQAIAAAKPGGTITFDPSLKGTIFLRSDSLSITKNLIIRGPGAGILSINGGQSDSNAGLEKVDLDIPKGASVFISGLTFKGSERFSSISKLCP